MTRTQITLEEDEYLFLKSEAAERGASLSSVIREMVRARMHVEPRGPHLAWQLAGILGDADYVNQGEERDLDDVLADAIFAEFHRGEEESV